MKNDRHNLNADPSIRVTVDTRAMDWTKSPGGHVLRKRMHLSGPAESGQVTSVVRYMAGARFPAHDHPEGEEILVLDGVFSDEHGDWPAGTYLLNPEGFHHAPFSEQGCTLLVKLRQFPGLDRQHIAVQVNDIPWTATGDGGVSSKTLYSQQPYSDCTRMERWGSPRDRGEIAFPMGAEIFVVKGNFDDQFGSYRSQSWLRVPAGESVTPSGGHSCEVYIKEGGFPYLH
tara:strand:- start:442825 stop:443511 length:687 start_codon:yes stop_codon:yes gene_type:complete